MAKVTIAVKRSQMGAFKEMLDTHDLVDIIEIKVPAASSPHPVLFTVDAGVGNNVNYFYLGKAWGEILKAKGGQNG